MVNKYHRWFSEVINYTITIARIFANLVAAYILLKLNPRKASIVALVLLCFSFVAVFATNYWLYTIARMIMALGGSMIMVYMNTVVARFIANDEKIIASALVTASYNIGAGLVAIIFFYIKMWLSVIGNIQCMYLAYLVFCF